MQQGNCALPQGNSFSGSYQGNVSIDRLASIDKKYGQDFLSWKTLQISGIKASDKQRKSSRSASAIFIHACWSIPMAASTC